MAPRFALPAKAGGQGSRLAREGSSLAPDLPGPALYGKLNGHKWRISFGVLDQPLPHQSRMIMSFTSDASIQRKIRQTICKWDLHAQNLMSEYHLRYGGYGGIGYYMVSDMYIALFSRFTTCGSWEGHNILDYLVENDSDVMPDRRAVRTRYQDNGQLAASRYR